MAELANKPTKQEAAKLQTERLIDREVMSVTLHEFGSSCKKTPIIVERSLKKQGFYPGSVVYSHLEASPYYPIGESMKDNGNDCTGWGSAPRI